MLTEIKNYLHNHQRSSLLELSRRFDVNSQVMRDMLKVLMRKGWVKQCMKTPRCGVKCSQCDVITVEIYEWIACDVCTTCPSLRASALPSY